MGKDNRFRSFYGVLQGEKHQDLENEKWLRGAK